MNLHFAGFCNFNGSMSSFSLPGLSKTTYLQVNWVDNYLMKYISTWAATWIECGKQDYLVVLSRTMEFYYSLERLIGQNETLSSSFHFL